ncbi:MAG: adenosylcobinamide-phosphate synthase CbiB [Microcystaceae cyanobacterium]
MIVESKAAIALVGAALLDYIIGDPWGWIHPVQVMGWFISHLSQLLITHCPQKWQRRLGGIALGLTIIIGSGLSGWLLITVATRLHPLLGLLLEIILLASCFAGRSLRLAALDVLAPLKEGNLVIARQKLSQYVGRDTEQLSQAEILRATVETVAENAIDGVTSPLFYAILGLIFPAIGSAPFALAYKASSTLDSMIGYRREPYTDIGWFSAKLEDLLTWFPCRLTVLNLAVLSGKPKTVLSICYRDAPQDPSPNSGWSEAVYAGILGVQLGGKNTYQGEVKMKPLLGDPLSPITPETVTDGLNLTRIVYLLWLGLSVITNQLTVILSVLLSPDFPNYL